jgi:hypothetical protein
MSPELQNKRAAFAQALSQAESQGFVAEAATAARELASNPGLLASMAIEQIPQFLASFGIGRGAVAIGQRVGATGARASVALVPPSERPLDCRVATSPGRPTKM